MAQVNTINVVETIGESNIDVRSFTDDDEGKCEAENYMVELLLDNDVSRTALDDILDEGHYSEPDGDWVVYITSSI